MRVPGPRCFVCGAAVDNPDALRTIEDDGSDDLCAIHRAAQQADQDGALLADGKSTHYRG